MSLFLHVYRFQLLFCVLFRFPFLFIPVTFPDSGYLIFQTPMLSNVTSKNF